LIIFIGPLSGSDKIYDRSENNSYVVKYTPSTPSEREINNYFIKEIAKNNFTNLNNTRFTFHYAIHKSISKVADYTFKVTAEIGGELCTGDIFYKGFDISDILMPEKVDFTVFVINNNNYYKVKEFTEVVRNDEDKFTATFLFETYDEEAQFTLDLNEINFYSVNNDKEKFQQRLNYIDEYYASIAFFDYGNEQLSNLNITPKTIVSSYIKVKELERIYNSIAKTDFIRTLDFSRKRDSDFWEKMDRFQVNLYKTVNNIEILITSADFIDLNQSYASAAKQYVDEISSYFLMSQEVSHSNSAYFFNYGKVAYNQNLFKDYFSGLNKILLRTKFCNEIYAVSRRLEKEIFNAYLNKANDFIEKEQYFIAKGLLGNARSFHDFYSNSALPLDLHFYYSKANYGIYDSYLHLIDRAIEIGNYNLAENYILKAKNFQIQNSATIISSEYTTRISEKLIRLYINKGELLNENGEFVEAMYCFNQAQNICRDIGFFNFDYEIKHGLIAASNGTYSDLIARAHEEFENNDIASADDLLSQATLLRSDYPWKIEHSYKLDELKSMVNAHYYQTYVVDGKSYLENGNYYLAYEYFLKAFELEEISNFEIYDSLPYFFVQAAKPYLIDQCKLGEVKVKKNQLDEAREIYDRCFVLQMEYGIDYDPILQESLTKLNNSIFYRHCELANYNFDHIIDQFNNAVGTGDFINAMQVLDRTNEVMSENYYCEFDKSLVAELKNKYSPAAEYQMLANKAKDALNRNDHETFIETHKKMEELSSNYEVIRKMVEPMPLHYLFSVKKNLALIENAVKDYENKEEFETALKLLKVLQANNYSDRDTKAIQQNLASRMAYIDKQSADPETDPRIKADNYTDGSAWYKHFKKTYVKNW
jgi:hypothetical protein